MNKIIFDKIVCEDQNTFAFVTLPKANEDIVPTKGQFISYEI